ncbi:TatD family hydrolase [Helicobacter sp. MIT 14-3879]|uniref:TatD family hydrolase n=1 Tax=Helicobacter sp. MIT 14-3879 TaxID=2040649 RepID=UPI000E1EEFE4|nr:TatD family hydrolase [Helicobacter sp. MIT 14-3879]RDU64717.1 hydrolase TatD [Helicobacter sp. MIT 14-3879]
MYIDTHCHLDSEKYNDNLETIINNSINLGLEKIVIPGADIADLTKAIKISEKFDMVYFAAGIHPNEINSLNKNSIAMLKDALMHEKCVAVGEIGLDYYYLDSDINNAKMLQESGFRLQIELAIEKNKPIIIHTRNSNVDIIRILNNYEFEKGIIFHCFGGDMGLVNSLNCDLYYGIGGIISFKNAKKLQNSVKNLPLNSIILETDAPYLAPVPHRGEINSPEYIPIIASHLANNLDCDISEIASLSTQNASRVFGF